MSIEGVVIPNLTPMDSAGEKLAGEATERLTDFLIVKGVNALFVGGTTGEGPLLSIQERKDLTEWVVAAARGRVATVVQAGATTTAILSSWPFMPRKREQARSPASRPTTSRSTSARWNASS